jgi:Flp pilus assembly protein TadD
MASWHLVRALSLKPEWASAHRQLGSVYARLGMWFAASGEYQKAMKLKPQLSGELSGPTAQVSYRAGIAFLEQGRPQGAVSMLRQALRYRPKWPAARHYLAYAYASAGKWDDAVRELEQISNSGDALVAENLRRARTHEPLTAPEPDLRG